MNDAPAISIKGVTRGYGGDPILRGLDLTVPRGSVYGFLGRNGSGKTTTIKMLAGLIRPEGGSVEILGGDPWAFGAKERQNLGYMSERQTLPPLMRVSGLVNFCARFYPEWDGALCDGLLSRFDVPANRRIMRLSMGQQRLVGFALAIAPRPDVLLLDEPAANLDVVARREFLDQVLDLIRDGEKTVLFSTHILSDVERVADRVGILAGGRLVADDDLDALKESVREVRFYGFRGEIPEAIPGALSAKIGRGEVLAVLSGGASASRLAEQMGCAAEERELPLEDLFVELTKNTR